MKTRISVTFATVYMKKKLRGFGPLANYSSVQKCPPELFESLITVYIINEPYVRDAHYTASQLYPHQKCGYYGEL
jgi:hypothetical protein